MLPSVYGSFRQWGSDPNLALLGHFVIAVPVFLTTLAAFFSTGDSRSRSLLLLIATFIVTPYALIYDLGMAVAAVGLMVTPATAENHGDGKWLRMLIATAMLIPIWMMPAGAVWLPVAPLFLIAVYAVALTQSGFFYRPGLRRGANLLERRI